MNETAGLAYIAGQHSDPRNHLIDGLTTTKHDSHIHSSGPHPLAPSTTSMPFSTTHTSSSASSPFHSRTAPVPIVLRGPEKDSRRYITELPRTLDGLLIKARSLFPVPPGNTPYITLDADDDQTVILEDAIPFLREREVLVFRWSPDTPRKCSGNRVKWDESVGASVNAKPVTHTQPTTSASTSTSTSALASALAPPPTPAPSSSSRPTPARPFSAIHQQHQQRTQAHLHRAAHVKRVLEEQRRQREQEQEQEQQEQEQHRLQQDQSHADDTEMDPTADAPLSTSGHIDTTEEEPSHQPQQPHQSAATATATSTATTIPEPHPNHSTMFTSSMTQSDLEVSGSSPPPYSSPHAPTTTAPADHHHDHNSHIHNRCSTPDQEHDSGSDDGPPSSPLVSSPTRDVHAAVLKTSMSPHGADHLVAGRSPDCVRPTEEEQAVVDGGGKGDAEENAVQEDAAIVEHHHAAEDEAMNSDDELECNDLLQSTPPQANSPLRAEEADADEAPPAAQSPDCDKLYRTMSAVIANLQNHPSNVSLRDGLAVEFHSFAQDSGDSAVDLRIISHKLQQRAYGTDQDALGLFRRDLKRLWTLVRDFYGPRSAQGQCATVLDKFAEVVLNEWKGRSANGGAQVAVPAIATATAHQSAATGMKRKLSSSSSSKDDAKSSSAAARQRAAAVMASFQQQQGRRAKAAKRATPGVRRKMGGPHAAAGDGAGAGAGNGLQWPDMMAFHRAIMGGDEKKVVPMQMHIPLTVAEVAPENVAPVDTEMGIDQVIPEKRHAAAAASTVSSTPRRDDVGDNSDDELSSAPPSPALSPAPAPVPAAAQKKSKATTFTTAAATGASSPSSTSPSRGRRGSRRASRMPRRYATGEQGVVAVQ